MPNTLQPGPDTISELIDKGRVSAQQITVIILCMILNMLDGFDITAMSIVNTAVAAELNLTPDRLGLISSAALFGMACGAMFLAPLSDLFGRKRVVLVSVLMVSISIMFTANATSYAEFIILRIISGLGVGAMLASQAALAIEYSPDKYKALSVTLVTSGYPLGGMMTALVGDFIMPAYGWRGMFWFGGGLTLLMGFLVLFVLPESLQFLAQRQPKMALEKINRILGRLADTELTALPPRPALSEQKSALENFKAMFGPLYWQKTALLWTTFLLCFSALYFLFTWIPALMEFSGFTAETGRDAFFLFNLGAVIGIYILGMLSTRFKLSNIVCVFLLGGGILLIAFAASPGVEILLLSLVFLIGILFQGGFTGLYAVSAKLYPSEIRSTGVGWAIGLGRVGAVIGPGVAGFLIAAGLGMSANFYIFAVPVVLAGIIAYRLHIN
jgi:AAHS family 4-hydroxybenzoate transporter-like MFS transporter